MLIAELVLMEVNINTASFESAFLSKPVHCVHASHNFAVRNMNFIRNNTNKVRFKPIFVRISESCRANLVQFISLVFELLELFDQVGAFLKSRSQRVARLVSLRHT